MIKLLRSNIGAVAFCTMALAVIQVKAVPSLFNGHYYEILDAPGIDWATANSLANAASYLGLPGHLATLTSAAEDAFVHALNMATSDPYEVWVGGFQSPSNEQVATAGWTWVNGEGAFPGNNLGPQYSNWLGGEPNDAGGPGYEQHLGILLGGQFGWNDEGHLGNIRGYAVEYEATPDGGFSVAFLGGALVLLGTWRRKFNP